MSELSKKENSFQEFKQVMQQQSQELGQQKMNSSHFNACDPPYQLQNSPGKSSTVCYFLCEFEDFCTPQI